MLTYLTSEHTRLQDAIKVVLVDVVLLHNCETVNFNRTLEVFVIYGLELDPPPLVY